MSAPLRFGKPPTYEQTAAMVAQIFRPPRGSVMKEAIARLTDNLHWHAQEIHAARYRAAKSAAQSAPHTPPYSKQMETPNKPNPTETEAAA